MDFATWTETPYGDPTSTDTPRRRGSTEFYVTDTRDVDYEQRKQKMEEVYEEAIKREKELQPKFLLNEQIKLKPKQNEIDIVKDIISQNVCRRMMNSRR